MSQKQKNRVSRMRLICNVLGILLCLLVWLCALGINAATVFLVLKPLFIITRKDSLSSHSSSSSSTSAYTTTTTTASGGNSSSSSIWWWPTLRASTTTSGDGDGGGGGGGILSLFTTAIGNSQNNSNHSSSSMSIGKFFSNSGSGSNSSSSNNGFTTAILSRGWGGSGSGWGSGGGWGAPGLGSTSTTSSSSTSYEEQTAATREQSIATTTITGGGGTAAALAAGASWFLGGVKSVLLFCIPTRFFSSTSSTHIKKDTQNSLASFFLSFNHEEETYTDIGIFLLVLYQVLTVLALVSHLLAVLTDPGSTKSAPRDAPAGYIGQTNRCSKCADRWKPPRAHHCKVCGECILRMDHHCPWINNCVGYLNQKYFILFLVYTSGACAITVLIFLAGGCRWLLLTAAQRAATQEKYASSLCPQWLLACCAALALAAAIFFLVMSLDFLSEQWEALETNTTLVETYKNVSGRRELPLLYTHVFDGNFVDSSVRRKTPNAGAQGRQEVFYSLEASPEPSK